MAKSTTKLWTAKEAADNLGISDARVRQLCIEHGIGILKGTTRILVKADMERLKYVRAALRKYEKSERSQ